MPGENQKQEVSLFVVQDVKAGEVFTLKNVRSIRPGDGRHTHYLSEVIGRQAASDIERAHSELEAPCIKAEAEFGFIERP